MNEFNFDIQRFANISNAADNTLITGTANADTISSTGNNVTINALGGADSINVNYSSAGAYIQYAKGDGNDTITGYTSEDNAFNYQLSISGSAYTSAASGANVIIGVGTDSITIQDGISDAGVKGIDINGSYRDSLGNIPNSKDEVTVYGTEDADSINNKGQTVTIQAYGGNDTIENAAGSSAYIDAGEGNDLIYNEGGSTGVKILGGDGADTINNSNGANASIIGGAGADSILTQNSNDVSIIGGDGADTISADGARVYISGDAGADNITNYGINGTSVFGGDGADTIKNTGYGNSIYGGSFDGSDTDDDDVIDNTNGSKAYYGETSNQLNSAVSIYGGVGADSIKNDGNNVLVEGGDGADTIVNESYLVTITTDGALYDHYEGGQGTTLNGGDGNDFISNDSENVTVAGGTGNDTVSLGSNSSSAVIQYNSGDGNDSITGFTTSDTLIIGSGTGTYSTQTSGNDIIVTSYGGYITLTGAATLSALNINGELSGDSSTNQTITGATWTGTDADEEHGTTDYDPGTQKTTLYSALYGMGGKDKLTNYPAFANVTIDGGTGNDQIYNRGAYGSLIGGAGDDYIDNRGIDNAKVNNSTIDGGAGADVVDNLGDNVLISVGDGADRVYSTGDSVKITGGAGADTLNSYGNYSSIDGGADDDNLTASGSNVTVQGGAGNDTLQFSGGSESIAANGIVEDTVGNNYFHSEYITTSTITGGTGNDSLHSEHIESVTINLGAGNNSVNSKYDKNITINAAGGDDTLNIYDGNNIVVDVGDGANYIDIENLNDETASGYTVTTGTGNDTVYTYIGSNALISTGDGNDSIGNSDANATINGGDGDDYINNGYGYDYSTYPTMGANSLLEGGKGNDSIGNSGENVTLDGGDDDDKLTSIGVDNILMIGGDGNDTINNLSNINRVTGKNVTMLGGAGNDYFYNLGSNATINGGTGDDTIIFTSDRYGNNSANVLITYANGDGNDLIQYFNDSDTLSIGGGTYTSAVSGDDVILTVGDGKITLEGAATLDTLNIVGGEAVENWATVTTGTISTAIAQSATVASGTTGADTITTATIEGDTTARLIEGNGGNDSILNFVSNVTISGGADKDSVVSSADNVVIQTGGGNDYIQGATKGNVNITIDAGEGDDEIDTYGTNASINGGAGNDSIKISADSEKVTVLAGEGSDTVVNTATNSFIDGGAGADSIHNDSGNVTIDAGADDDVITSYGDKVSISGGAGADKITVTNSYDGVGTISGGIGDDTISIGSGNFLLEYTSGDGADVVQGFKANDTLSIDGTFTSVKSGDDVVLTVGDGNITLGNAASLETLNIVGDNSNAAAEGFITALEKKTELGYPIIAALFFHPEEYHGFDTLPSSYYVESETLTINSSDGFELTGFHYTPENPSDKWVILVHGYGHNHRHMNGFAQQYLTNNYHVLMVDQRAAGESEGEWLTMSAGESKDLVLWTHKVAELNSNAKITLHGVSMGAATAMLAAANSDLTNVTSLIEDCGYTSVLKLVDIVKSAYTSLGDPAFVSLVNDTAGSLTGYKLDEAAPIDSIGSATVPSMFITGTSDVVVSMSMLESLYAASGAEVKEIFTVAGATHGVSALTDSIGYANTVFRFNAEAAGEGWITSNVTDNISLRGTKYDDTITTSGSNVTINTGLGDDTITNTGSAVIQYNSGDGADVINGFTASDTLIVGSGTGVYSTLANGDDVVVSVGAGSITLQDAANLSALNIQGSYSPAYPAWATITPAEGDASIITSNDTVANGSYDADTITTASLESDDATRVVNADSGNDIITNRIANVSIDGGDDNDVITNYAVNATLSGGYGDDTINNSVTGGVVIAYNDYEGADVVNGFTASDTLVIDGGSGSYSTVSANTNVIVKTYDGSITLNNVASLSALNIQGTYDAGDVTGLNAYNTVNNTLVSGTSDNDSLVNAGGSNVTLRGLAGDDTISNIDNNKTFIDAGDGDDLIFNTSTYGIVTLASGEETLVNPYGDTSIVAGAGDDRLNIIGGNNVSVSAGEGNDSIFSFHSYYKTVDGGAGNDFINISEGHHENIYGGDGNDTIIGTVLFETLKGDWAMGGYAQIDGGAGADYVSVGYSNNSTITGGDGDDTIITYGPNSKVFGGDGNDSISLISNSETTLTSAGTTITGGAGDDTITGDGSGVIYNYTSGDGNDVINGITANDLVLIDGLEFSTVTSGNDVVVTAGENNITLTDAATVSGLKIRSALAVDNTVNNTLVAGTPADDLIYNTGSNVTINGLAGNDTINNFDNNQTFIDSSDGDDLVINKLTYEVATVNGKEVLHNYYSDTSITTGAGNDSVFVEGGYNVSITTGEGIDSIYSKHSYNQTIDAGAGDDFIGLTEGHNEYISAGDGADTIIGETATGKWAMGGYATIDGGAGADYVSVGYSNNASITGGDGNDTIITYGTNSEIYGGAGNDVITLITDTTNTGLNSAGTTVTGGAGDDTITSDGSGIVVKYSAGDGNDVITGLSASDTVLIDSAYKASVSGNDIVVTVSSSQETLTLKNAASTQPNLSVAIIAQGDSTYAYTSIAEAATNADDGSTVTVIADSTETATIPSDKNLTIQFAESDTSVYNASGGNFVSAADFEGFTADSLVSAGGNTISIANGSTATFNGYAVTGNSNGYTFALQSNAAQINGIDFSGAGTASFDTKGNISLTSGAVATMADGDAATFNLGAGSYTLNGNTVSAAADKAITINSDTAQFVVTSDSISYNAFTFSGSGAASVANDIPTLTAGVAVYRDGRDMVVLTEKGQNTINGRGFEMTEAISGGITVGAVDNGIGAAHIVSAEDFPEDAGKTFAEEAIINGDDSYTVRLTHEGIKSIYGISAGSSVRGTAYLDGEVDTLGSILQLAVDSPGIYNLANKAYTLSGAIDSENVVALSSRFYTDNTAALKNVYYLNGMISGDFSSAVTINNAPMDVQVLGDTNISVYATDNVKPAADANSSVISSSGNATSITGVGNGASIISAGGATKVSTNEEGVFTFRSDADTQQGFTVTGDDSVDFILQNYTDENGNATMQVAGVNNFENGFYTISKDSAYHVINAGENIAAGDELVIGFADTATFVIADSKVVSVNGVDYSINRLKGDVAVHAANAVTVNGVYADVAGDDNFDVIVSDSKVASLVNISAGASVSVESVDIVTDNSGEFKIGEYVYNLDVDGGVTFTTDSNGAVKNISGVTGTLNTSANNITLNGAKFTTTNTDVTITAADSEINWVEGLASGDSISGELDSATISLPANADSDTVAVTVNATGYTLNDDSTGIQITNNFISGLDSGARLQISQAGVYTVNGTQLTSNVGDTIIGTAEGAAYIYDPNNIPLDITTMSTDEISAQVGIPASYSDVETDTNVAGLAVANGGASTLNGTMALALDNTGANVEQTADFSNATGRKRVTLEGGDQAVKFNDEGKNVAVIDSDATGEKNVSLGDGGDLAIVEDTDVPVNITTGKGKDTVVTAGKDVFVEMGSGAGKIVPNAGNVALNNYNAATGAGIQLNEFADLTRAILSGNITLEIGAITFNDVHVRFGAEDEAASIVNLFNNEGKKQKVAYTNGDGGVADLSGEKENVMLVGNTGNNTSMTGGTGDDTAIGGAGDYIDLGAGNNYISLGDNSGASQGAVVGFTSQEGRTEVDGFTGGFSDNADRVFMDISIGQVTFSGGKLTFTNGGGTLILNGMSSSADLAESADLMTDDNFIANDNFIADDNFITGTTLDENTPITCAQGDYQNLYDTTFATGQDSLSGGVNVTFANA